MLSVRFSSLEAGVFQFRVLDMSVQCMQVLHAAGWQPLALKRPVVPPCLNAKECAPWEMQASCVTWDGNLNWPILSPPNGQSPWPQTWVCIQLRLTGIA